MNNRMRRYLFLGLAIVCCFATSVLLDPMLQLRQRYELTSDPMRGSSPAAVVTQVFGWARGIIIDVVWIRAEGLKQQERFFELAQLADWSCKLTPRMPKVWDVQAWNMAYNVSCLVDYFPDRWSWVWSSVELLRDQGIPNNPNAYDLYKSLAWTIFHKIGEQDDNAHHFYKARFAMMMDDLLGGSAPIPVLTALSLAPTTRRELLAKSSVGADGGATHVGGEQIDANEGVRLLVKECKEKGNFDIIDDYFRWFHTTTPEAFDEDEVDLGDRRDPAYIPPICMMDDSGRDLIDVTLASFSVPPEVTVLMRSLFTGRDPKTDEPLSGARQHQVALMRKGLDKIAVFARARRLRNEFKMQPDRMRRVVELFRPRGDAPDPPVDWRSPYPHSIYWAMEGLVILDGARRRRRDTELRHGYFQTLRHSRTSSVTEEDEDTFQASENALYRFVYFAMMNTVKHGRLLFDSKGGFMYEVGPEYRLADAMIPHFQFLLGPQSPMSKRTQEGVRTAYRGYLGTYVAEFAFLEQDAKVRQFFNLVKQEFPEDTMLNRARGDLKTFVDMTCRAYGSEMTFSQARNKFRSIMVRYWRNWAAGRDQIAQYCFNRAERYLNEYDEREMEKFLRGRVRREAILESVIADILRSRDEPIPGLTFTPDLYAALVARLNADAPEMYAAMLEMIEGKGDRIGATKGVGRQDRYDSTQALKTKQWLEDDDYDSGRGH
jgi:hypothetical protein